MRKSCPKPRPHEEELAATHADLQVRGGNLPAQQLYASLGFEAVYGYHYRVKQVLVTA